MTHFVRRRSSKTHPNPAFPGTWRSRRVPGGTANRAERLSFVPLAMKFPRFVLLLASVVPAFAGLNSAVIVLPSESGRGAPAVSLVQTADYLCAIVTLRTTVGD